MAKARYPLSLSALLANLQLNWGRFFATLDQMAPVEHLPTYSVQHHMVSLLLSHAPYDSPYMLVPRFKFPAEPTIRRSVTGHQTLAQGSH